MRFFPLVSICFAALSTAGYSAFAQQAQAPQPAAAAGENREGLPASYKGPADAVAAVVSDEVISTFDVQQRMRLMILTSGGQVNPQMLGQLQTQALKDLVDEKLKFIEAKKFELTPAEAEVESELQNMAAQGGVTLEGMEQALAADGISMDSLKSQIGASLIWPRLVQGRYGNRVRVSDEEIETTIERMREEAGTEQFLVSEICVPVPSPDEAQQYYEGSLQLIEQMRQGVPFAIVAQQFSACTSAASGGDMGWIRPGELPVEIDEVVKTLPVGSVSSPIPSEGAFMIVAVRDRREAVVQGEKSFTLAYASAPLSMGRNAARQALEKIKTAGACGGSGLRQDLGADVGIALVENAKLGDIDERFHTAIEDLDRGDVSPAIEADEFLHVTYVCELDEGLGIPSRRTLEDRIYSRQLNKISQQYLRDVERKTMVDIRVRSEPQPQQGGGAPQGPNG
ncbi:MAG: peptidylprolyl isomerase [Pseudomonadota bacterium]